MTILFTADLHRSIPARHPRTGQTSPEALMEFDLSTSREKRRYEPELAPAILNTVNRNCKIFGMNI